MLYSLELLRRMSSDPHPPGTVAMDFLVWRTVGNRFLFLVNYPRLSSSVTATETN